MAMRDDRRMRRKSKAPMTIESAPASTLSAKRPIGMA